METIRLKLTGEAPLIMQADTLADPLHPLKLKLEEQTKVKNKTAVHHREIARIEFEGGLYLNEHGPYVPADMVQKCFVEAARLSKAGKQIERGVLVVDDMPLQYTGPRTLDALSADPRYSYRKTVVIQRRRTVRVRPIFREWSLVASIGFDTAIISQRTLLEVAERAGQYIGIGNRRPNLGGSFGRFSVSPA